MEAIVQQLGEGLGMDEEVLERLVQAFQALDANGDGKLSKQELKAVCGDNEQLDKIFSSIDADGSGEIDLTEFMRGFGKLQCQEEDEPAPSSSEDVQMLRELESIFRFVDADHSGTISFEELVQAAEVSGKQITEIDVLKLREAFAIHSSDDQIDFERFKEVFVFLRSPEHSSVPHRRETVQPASDRYRDHSEWDTEKSAVYLSDGDPALLEARQEIMILEKRLATALDEQDNAMSNSQELRYGLQAAIEDKASVQAKLDRLEGTVTAIKEELISVKVELELTSRELQEAQTKNLELVQDHARILRTLHEKERLILELEEDKEVLQQNLDNLDMARGERVFYLEERMQGLKNELKSKEISWEETRGTLDNELSSLRNQLEDLMDERINLVEERDELQTSVKSLSEALSYPRVDTQTPPATPQLIHRFASSKELSRRKSLAEEMQDAMTNAAASTTPLWRARRTSKKSLSVDISDSMQNESSSASLNPNEVSLTRSSLSNIEGAPQIKDHWRRQTLVQLSEDTAEEPNMLISVSGSTNRVFQAPKTAFLGDYLGLAQNPNLKKMILEAGGHDEEVLLFTDMVQSISKKWSMFDKQGRPDESRSMVILTSKALYNVRMYLFGFLTTHRRIPLSDMSGIHISPKAAGVFVIKVPTSHDYMYRTARWMELVSEIRKAYLTLTTTRLDMEFTDEIIWKTEDGASARTHVDVATQEMYLCLLPPVQPANHNPNPSNPNPRAIPNSDAISNPNPNPNPNSDRIESEPCTPAEAGSQLLMCGLQSSTCGL